MSKPKHTESREKASAAFENQNNIEKILNIEAGVEDRKKRSLSLINHFLCRIRVNTTTLIYIPQLSPHLYTSRGVEV